MLWLIPLAAAAGTAIAQAATRKDSPDFKPAEMPDRKNYELPNADYHRGVSSALLGAFGGASSASGQTGPAVTGNGAAPSGTTAPKVAGMTGARRK